MSPQQPVDNPWAPPVTRTLEAPIEGGVWREGSEVVMLRQAELPKRCVHCNAAVDGRIGKRRIYWHHPGWYALLLLNIVLYALVAIFVRQTAVIQPGLCTQHRRWRIAVLLGGALVLAGLLGLTFVRLTHSGPALLGGVGASVVVIVLTAWLSRTVRPSLINHRRIRLKGAGPAFLDSLPSSGPS